MPMSSSEFSFEQIAHFSHSSQRAHDDAQGWGRARMCLMRVDAEWNVNCMLLCFYMVFYYHYATAQKFSSLAVYSMPASNYLSSKKKSSREISSTWNGTLRYFAINWITFKRAVYRNRSSTIVCASRQCSLLQVRVKFTTFQSHVLCILCIFIHIARLTGEYIIIPRERS